MANSNRNNNPGNFANDPERAREAGSAGGKATHRADKDNNSQEFGADTDMDLNEDMDTV